MGFRLAEGLGQEITGECCSALQTNQREDMHRNVKEWAAKVRAGDVRAISRALTPAQTPAVLPLSDQRSAYTNNPPEPRAPRSERPRTRPHLPCRKASP